jgi:hypothetical protein
VTAYLILAKNFATRTVTNSGEATAVLPQYRLKHIETPSLFFDWARKAKTEVRPAAPHWTLC